MENKFTDAGYDSDGASDKVTYTFKSTRNDPHQRAVFDSFVKYQNELLRIAEDYYSVMCEMGVVQLVNGKLQIIDQAGRLVHFYTEQLDIEANRTVAKQLIRFIAFTMFGLTDLRPNEAIELKRATELRLEEARDAIDLNRATELSLEEAIVDIDLKRAMDISLEEEKTQRVTKEPIQRMGSPLNDDEYDNSYKKPTFYLTMCNGGSDYIGYYVGQQKLLYTNQCILISIMDHLKLLGRLNVNCSIAWFRENNGISNKLWDPHSDFQFANNNDQTTILINIMINHKLRLKFVIPYYNESDKTLLWTTNPVVNYPDYKDSDCVYPISNVYILNTPNHFALLINGFDENRYTHEMKDWLIENNRTTCKYSIADVNEINQNNIKRATEYIDQYKIDINQLKKADPVKYLRIKIQELTQNIDAYGPKYPNMVRDMQNTINDMTKAIEQNTAADYIKNYFKNKYLKYKQKYLQLKNLLKKQ